jgi:uncharacterized protein (DUF58 family)
VEDPRNFIDKLRDEYLRTILQDDPKFDPSLDAETTRQLKKMRSLSIMRWVMRTNIFFILDLVSKIFLELISRKKPFENRAPLAGLVKISAWIPSRKLRDELKKMLADDQPEIQELIHEGRSTVARWRTACCKVRYFWMIGASIVNFVPSKCVATAKAWVGIK